MNKFFYNKKNLFSPINNTKLSYYRQPLFLAKFILLILRLRSIGVFTLWLRSDLRKSEVLWGLWGGSGGEALPLALPPDITPDKTIFDGENLCCATKGLRNDLRKSDLRKSEGGNLSAAKVTGPTFGWPGYPIRSEALPPGKTIFQPFNIVNLVFTFGFYPAFPKDEGASFGKARFSPFLMLKTKNQPSEAKLGYSCGRANGLPGVMSGGSARGNASPPEPPLSPQSPAKRSWRSTGMVKTKQDLGLPFNFFSLLRSIKREKVFALHTPCFAAQALLVSQKNALTKLISFKKLYLKQKKVFYLLNRSSNNKFKKQKNKIFLNSKNLNLFLKNFFSDHEIILENTKIFNFFNFYKLKFSFFKEKQFIFKNFFFISKKLKTLKKKILTKTKKIYYYNYFFFKIISVANDEFIFKIIKPNFVAQAKLGLRSKGSNYVVPTTLHSSNTVAFGFPMPSKARLGCTNFVCTTTKAAAAQFSPSKMVLSGVVSGGSARGNVRVCFSLWGADGVPRPTKGWPSYLSCAKVTPPEPPEPPQSPSLFRRSLFRKSLRSPLVAQHKFSPSKMVLLRLRRLVFTKGKNTSLFRRSLFRRSLFRRSLRSQRVNAPPPNASHPKATGKFNYYNFLLNLYSFNNKKKFLKFFYQNTSINTFLKTPLIIYYTRIKIFNKLVILKNLNVLKFRINSIKDISKLLLKTLIVNKHKQNIKKRKFISINRVNIYFIEIIIKLKLNLFTKKLLNSFSLTIKKENVNLYLIKFMFKNLKTNKINKILIIKNKYYMFPNYYLQKNNIYFLKIIFLKSQISTFFNHYIVTPKEILVILAQIYASLNSIAKRYKSASHSRAWQVSPTTTKLWKFNPAMLYNPSSPNKTWSGYPDQPKSKNWLALAQLWEATLYRSSKDMLKSGGCAHRLRDAKDNFSTTLITKFYFNFVKITKSLSSLKNRGLTTNLIAGVSQKRLVFTLWAKVVTIEKVRGNVRVCFSLWGADGVPRPTKGWPSYLSCAKVTPPEPPEHRRLRMGYPDQPKVGPHPSEQQTSEQQTSEQQTSEKQTSEKQTSEKQTLAVLRYASHPEQFSPSQSPSLFRRSLRSQRVRRLTLNRKIWQNLSVKTPLLITKLNYVDLAIDLERIFNKFYKLTNNLRSVYHLFLQSKFNFVKNYFFFMYLIPFLNKQLNRFLYLFIFLEKLKTHFFIHFLKFIFLSRIKKIKVKFLINENILNFLNISLFSFFFEWGKKQHKNNPNSWIFNKYWLFLQPLAYFSLKKFFSKKIEKIFLKKGKQKLYLLDNKFLKKELIIVKINAILVKSNFNKLKSIDYKLNILKINSIFFLEKKQMLITEKSLKNLFYFKKIKHFNNSKIESFVPLKKKKFKILISKIQNNLFSNLKTVSIKIKKRKNKLNKNLNYKKNILKTWYLEKYKKKIFILKINSNIEYLVFNLYLNNQLEAKNKKITNSYLKKIFKIIKIKFIKKNTQYLLKNFYKKILNQNFNYLNYRKILLYLLNNSFYFKEILKVSITPYKQSFLLYSFLDKI